MPSDGTYAPKSPDLSSFYSAPAPPPQPAAGSSAYQPPLPQSQYPHQGSPASFSQQPQQQPQSYLQPPEPYYHHPASPGTAPHRHPSLPQAAHHPQQPPPHSQQYLPPSPQEQRYPAQPSATEFIPQQHQTQPYYQVYSEQPYGFPPQPQGYPQPHSYPPVAAPFPGQQQSEAYLAADQMPPRRSAQAAPASPVIAPSPVRTKFPTARIKRIMQADEEVGKVAQQTPIAVGKALEMFMVALVSKSADVAKEKNSKRVSAQMLKQVVESDDQWDFLREIVGRVENEEKAGKSGGRAKAESESDEDLADAKKKARGGRKKKA